MKIVHITHHYYDGWGYQENLLPKYQNLSGNEVSMIADINHFLPSMSREEIDSIRNKGKEYFDGKVKIIRVKNYFNTSNTSFISTGLFRSLNKEKPQMIFMHGVDSSMFVVAAIYKLFHKKCVFYVDSHVDYINQSKNKKWVFFYNKLLLRLICLFISPLVDKYFGLSPLRCDYLNRVYHIPLGKIAFLPLGGDTEVVDSIERNRNDLRKKNGVPEDSFVIISGGKMSAEKGTLSLIDAFMNLKRKHANVSLVLFGSISDDVKEVIGKSNDNNIIVFGWCNRLDTLSLLKLSDVAVWPLLHTTLIDDAISCAVPIIVKKSGNTSHLIDECNGIYLKNGDSNELLHAIEMMLDRTKYQIILDNALRLKEKYSYKKIAEYINNIDNNYFIYGND